MKRFLIAAVAPLVLSACGGSGDDTTLSKMADDLISYVTTGHTVAENQRALVAGQGCNTDASVLGNGDCKVEASVDSGFVARDSQSVASQLSGARSTIYAVNSPPKDWSRPGGSANLHPYQKSADIMVVAVPPAAHQLDQPLGATDVMAGEGAEKGQNPVKSGEIPSNVAPSDVPPSDDVSSGDTTTITDDAVRATVLENDNTIPPDADNRAVKMAPASGDRPLAPAKVKNGDVKHKSMLPPAPVSVSAKTPAKNAAVKGKDAGQDNQSSVSGRDDADVSPVSDRVMAPANGKYVVLGSFASHRRAKIALHQYAQYHPQLIPATVAGTPYLRIAVGPMNMSRANDLRLVTAKNGIKDSWIISIVDSGE